MLKSKLGKRTYADLTLNMTAAEMRDRVTQTIDRNRNRYKALVKITDSIRANIEKQRGDREVISQLTQQARREFESYFNKQLPDEVEFVETNNQQEAIKT